MIDRDTLRLRLRQLRGESTLEGWNFNDEGLHRDPESDAPGVPAAVLIGLVAYPEGPHVILTRRTDHLRDHAGQVSLPGGRIESFDMSPEAAALRETFEEIGLAPQRVEILGTLPPYDTISGFRMHPVVGWIEPPVVFTLDPFEVADVFEVPLKFLIDSANHQRDSLVVEGRTRSFYVLPYPDRHIWGATAGILVNFARLLAV